MLRGGAYIVSDLPRDRLCRIACERCDREGAYRRETLSARFGDMALPDVLIALTACERRGDYSKPCGAGYVEPLGAYAPMIDDLDIWRAANLLIKRYGDDAAIHAAQRADELLAERDHEGCAVWKRILAAVG